MTHRKASPRRPPRKLPPRVARAQSQVPLPPAALESPLDARTPTALAGDYQHLVACTLTDLGRQRNIPPGMLVLGVFEFLALMIAQNFPDRNTATEEVARLRGLLEARTLELLTTPDTP
jgi:hypothetical protein